MSALTIPVNQMAEESVEEVKGRACGLTSLLGPSKMQCKGYTLRTLGTTTTTTPAIRT